MTGVTKAGRRLQKLSDILLLFAFMGNSVRIKTTMRQEVRSIILSASQTLWLI